MKKIFFILTILNFMAFNFAVAQSPQSSTELKSICENLETPVKLKFYTSYGKLTYDKRYPRKNLTQLGKNMGMFEEGDLASGLALVDVASEYELSTSSRKMINNAVCIIPQELSVYIGFQNPVIYLAQDLTPDSCLYNLVLRHEQIHQQINVNALEYFIPLIYQRVKLLSKQMKPMYVLSVQQIKSGTTEMTAYYAKKINKLVEEFKEEILVEQRKLDNRNQYNMESDICRRYEANHKQ